ncbi:hypothetical protein [uncultured Treponema sp.]|uniref:hypothetical protein n=1 Tax=uncultured Treponema sp. TaxID=162155 RepID=UPI0025E97284|nr:hypothetical protein [uncultured Treponema sp.]
MMRKIFRIGAGLAFAVLIASCGSSPKPKIEDRSASIPTEILEHKGTAWGVAQPEWVGTVLTTPNQKTLKKALGLTDKKIWVLTKNGSNLDFLQTWVDQVDARAEIAASIKQTIGDKIKASMAGTSSDTDIEKTIERESERLAVTSVAGLEKETDWWTRNRRLKDDVKKGESSDDYITQYSYMVVYAMDEELFVKQLNNGFKNIKDIDVSGEIQENIKNSLIDQSKIQTPDME